MRNYTFDWNHYAINAITAFTNPQTFQFLPISKSYLFPDLGT